MIDAQTNRTVLAKAPPQTRQQLPTGPPVRQTRASQERVTYLRTVQHQFMDEDLLTMEPQLAQMPPTPIPSGLAYQFHRYPEWGHPYATGHPLYQARPCYPPYAGCAAPWQGEALDDRSLMVHWLRTPGKIDDC